MAKGNSTDVGTSDGAGGMDQAFEAALKAASGAPDNQHAWEHLEELAADLQRPDDVAALYRELLERTLPDDVRGPLAERAVGFHDEWFGDSPETVTALLARIIELDTTADWAFERLTVMLTRAGQWNELLALYDRTLASTNDVERRRRLLDDATQVAKDFANEPERAADYLKQLVAIDPNNAQLLMSLERLLEKQGRDRDLINLWQSRIEELPADEARETRLRIATSWLERLGEPDRALEALREVLSDFPGQAEACRLLEQVLESAGATAETRRAALSLLRRNYLAAERPEDLVRVLMRALALTDPDERRPLHRECGSRLAQLGRDTEAMEQYAELLRADPTDADARRQLRQLAMRSERHDLHAQALIAAAETCEDEALRVTVLADAAQLYRTVLQDERTAVELYTNVLNSAEAEPSVALAAAHSLNELLKGAERADERLAVLERLATLETSSVVRRAVHAEAARLADSLGHTDRALANWQPVLEADPTDHAALSAIVDLLERAERWTDLLEALARRADVAGWPMQRRADLVRSAQVLAEKLGRVDAAVETWLAIREQFGENAETIAALDELMAEAKRWEGLAELLGATAQRERTRIGVLLVRVGDVHRMELDESERAASWYSLALGVDPRSQDARAGLEALLEDPSCAAQAGEALAEAYRQTDDWQRTLALLDQRVAAANTTARKVELLRQAATIHVERAEDAESALHTIARALPLDPTNVALESSLLELAASTTLWLAAADALGEAAEAMADLPARASELRRSQARILDEQLGDVSSAVTAYQQALALDGRDLTVMEALTRTAAVASRWDLAARAAVDAMALRRRIEPSLLAILEQHAEDAQSCRELAAAIHTAVSALASDGSSETVGRLPAIVAQNLEMIAAGWVRDRCGDLEAAEDTARCAVDYDPSQLEPLELLAALQRRAPSLDLIATLTKIDEQQPRSVDALYEAAMVGLESGLAPEHSVPLLERLFRKAGTLWARGELAQGEQTAPDAAEWALLQLVEYYVAAGQAEHAVIVLRDGAKLPLDAAKTGELRRRTAELLVIRGDRAQAIELFRGVLETTPRDAELLGRLAGLYEQDGRLAEAAVMRQRELELLDGPAERIALRMDLARLTGLIEERSGRIETLQANLADEPGHGPTLELLQQLLTERGRHRKLAELLQQQAEQLEQRNSQQAAALLWGRVATLAEEPLRDIELAIAAHGKVVELGSTHASLDALARLHLERAEPAEAARWVERRLESASDKERVAVLLQLARARMQAEKQDAAIKALQTAFSEAPRNAEVRKLLFKLYRNSKNWSALASALSVACEHVADEQTVLGYAREAAEIYHERLGTPADAVPVLRKAVAIAPEERPLRTMLAEGLRLSGELDEARALLGELIEGFGRRRSTERAALHLQLARVLHAQGATTEAIDELDRASTMDSSNVTILFTLAELARESGQLDRAERAYRTLLLQVRRAGAEGDTKLPIGPSEVLVELSRIARDRDQADKAAELLDSAMEALTQNDAEGAQLEARLQEQKESELLLRVLDTRLAGKQPPRRRAEILAKRAELLDTELDRPSDALEARLQAIDCNPGSPTHQQAAWDLAARLGELDRYVSEVESLLVDTPDSNAHVRCELMLRLGEVYEKSRSDLVRAAEYFAAAEATGVRQVDAWRAQARLAAAQGDEQEQLRLLGLLASLGEDQVETRASALYRMAEVQLSSEETLVEGIDSLRKALEAEPRIERAGLILRRAAEAHPTDADLLDLYERIAHESDDKETLLHYLEHRTRHPSGTPEQARQATHLALELEQPARAEALMLRAAEIGRETAESGGLAKVDWALLGLAAARMDALDLPGAVSWLTDAAEVAPLPDVFVLSSRVAELAAAPGGDLTLAAKLYDRLRERDPMARDAWQPLAQIYARLGEIESLERLVQETLDGLKDHADRNALRVELAHALLAHPARAEDAVSVLRDVLAEDPIHEAAQSMLMDYFERAGELEQVLGLMRHQLELAQSHEDVLAIKAAALQLGSRLGEDGRDEALEVYRRALNWGDDGDLLRALLVLLGPDHNATERAALFERLLATEQGEAAAELAIELAELYSLLSDEEGIMRTLRLGYERCPTNETLRAALEQRYRERGDYQGLAETLLEAASQQQGPAERVALLREAAAVYQDHLGDAPSAVTLLRQSAELLPDDVALRIELASVLVGSGDRSSGLEVLSEALEGADAEEARLDLFLSRAALRDPVVDETGILADLEAAFTIGQTKVAPALEDALQRARMSAADRGDLGAERSLTLRLVDVLLVREKRDQVSVLLAEWSDRAPDDVETLRLRRGLDAEDGRWNAVADTCERLLALEEAAAQIEAAIGLAQACRELGIPDRALAGLERVHGLQPENAAVRGELRAIYGHIGAQRELAALMLEEAATLDDPDARYGALLEGGQALVRVGDAAAAVPALRSALELKPQDSDAVAALSEAYILAGWFDDANTLLDAAIEGTRGRRTPELCVLLYRKAELAQTQGDPMRAVELLKEAHNCNKKNGEVAAALADLAEELEDWDLATKTLRTISLLDSDCPITRGQAFLRQGRIAYRLGDQKGALMWARRAKREEPDTAEIDQFIEELS